eukprot:1599472-Prymnesium_polylepis.1
MSEMCARVTRVEMGGSDLRSSRLGCGDWGGRRRWCYSYPRSPGELTNTLHNIRRAHAIHTQKSHRAFVSAASRWQSGRVRAGRREPRTRVKTAA